MTLDSAVWLAIAAGVVAILYGVVSVRWILAQPAGNARMQEIAAAIQAGAKAYLNRQYSTIAVVGVVLFVVLGFALGWPTAGGFAAGTYLGITLEKRLALGEQLVSVFTRKGEVLAPTLRSLGYRVTEFQGRGRDGEVAALYIEVPRRQAMKVVDDAREVDAIGGNLDHDVRLARRSPGRAQGGGLAA